MSCKETQSQAPNPQLSKSPFSPSNSSNGSRNTSPSTKHCGVVFFDLDDTLIPTEWIRGTFVEIRPAPKTQPSAVSSSYRDGSDEFRRGQASHDTSSFHRPFTALQSFMSQISHFQQSFSGSSINEFRGPVTVSEALSKNAQQQVRLRMDQSADTDLDMEVTHLIEAACHEFGVVVIVTNARSTAWLKIVSKLFPRLKQRLQMLGIPIIRAATSKSSTNDVETSTPTFTSPAEYIQFWTELKKTQFSRIVELTESLIKSFSFPLPLQSTYSSCLSTKSISRSSSQQAHSPGTVTKGPSTATLNLYEPLQVPSSSTSSSHSSYESVTLFLSPRTYAKETEVIRNVLQTSEDACTTLETDVLKRIIKHQIRKYMSSNNLSNLFCSAAPLLDIVCVGDSEFELSAARQLARSRPDIVRGCGLVKCKSGLSPNNFRDQLHDIGQTLKAIDKCRAQQARGFKFTTDFLQVELLLPSLIPSQNYRRSKFFDTNAQENGSRVAVEHSTYDASASKPPRSCSVSTNGSNGFHSPHHFQEQKIETAQNTTKREEMSSNNKLNVAKNRSEVLKPNEFPYDT